MAELRRLLIEPQRLPGPGGWLELQRQEQHYLQRVLRLRSGDGFAICDGVGNLHGAKLGAAGRVRQGPTLQRSAMPQPSLTLLAGLLRREQDTMLRMATELGVDRFLPLQAERSVPEPGERRQERWQSQLREASEQCERLWRPSLLPIQAASVALASPGPVQGQRWIAVTREELAPLLADELGSISTTAGEWQLACGPEGGWSNEERQLACLHGWRAVSLGPSILRAATAAVAALSLMQMRRQQLNGASIQP
jgi:16S rRNA (uracil1498-N3)-methyltransferase